MINKIVEGLDFNKAQDRHLGDLYEQILRDLQNAGNAGEFYTRARSPSSWWTWWPRNSARRSWTPACGTGGFPACAIEYVRTGST